MVVSLYPNATEFDLDGLPCMRLRQLLNFPCLLNSEPTWSITALQVLEPIDRYTRCTCGELKKSRLLFSIPASNTLLQAVSARNKQVGLK